MAIPPAPAPVATRLRPAPAATDPNAAENIDLALALGPDTRYHDAVRGVSATFPEGWKVQSATRWGNDHRENTVFLAPPGDTSARPSMYYKPYIPGEVAALTTTGAEALLRERARKKEASRVSGVPDYQNVPESFAFFDVNGSPAMSYFATFTFGNQVMTEHFIRMLGPNGYVMFFTKGKFEDVKAIMPQLRQMAGSVKGP